MFNQNGYFFNTEIAVKNQSSHIKINLLFLESNLHANYYFDYQTSKI